MTEFVLHGIHGTIAADVCRGRKYQVRCERCKKSEEITQHQFAAYLRDGWPACCGRTMSLLEIQRREVPHAE